MPITQGTDVLLMIHPFDGKLGEGRGRFLAFGMCFQFHVSNCCIPMWFFRPVVRLMFAENRFRRCHQWMVHLKLTTAFVLPGLFHPFVYQSDSGVEWMDNFPVPARYA